MRDLETWRRALAALVVFITPAACSVLGVWDAMTVSGTSFVYGFVVLVACCALFASAVCGYCPEVHRDPR